MRDPVLLLDGTPPAVLDAVPTADAQPTILGEPIIPKPLGRETMLWPPPFSKLSPLVGSPNTLKLDFCNRTGEEYKKAIKKHNNLHVPKFYGESRLSLLRTCKGFLNLMIVKRASRSLIQTSHFMVC